MSYERHGVFNIGPMGEKIADPGRAEVLAERSQAFKENMAMMSLQAQIQASQANKLQDQIMSNLERKHEQEKEDLKFERETRPAQQLAMLKLLSGIEGKNLDRAQRQEESLATSGYRSQMLSFKEREATRKNREVEDRIKREDSREERQYQRELESERRQEENRRYDRSLDAHYKWKEKEQKALEKAQEAARKALESAETKRNKEEDSARDSISKSDEIMLGLNSLIQGKDLDDGDISALLASSYVLSPKAKENLRDMLANSIKMWKDKKSEIIEAERQKITEASTSTSANIFSYIGGQVGQPYVDEKMGPITQDFQAKEAKLMQLLSLI